MVSHGHELGQRWVPEDGVVRQANVSDVEVDELGAVVVAVAVGVFVVAVGFLVVAVVVVVVVDRKSTRLNSSHSV